MLPFIVPGLAAIYQEISSICAKDRYGYGRIRAAENDDVVVQFWEFANNKPNTKTRTVHS